MTISESDVFYQLLGWTPPETVMQYCPSSHTVSAFPLCEREQHKMGMSSGVGGLSLTWDRYQPGLATLCDITKAGLYVVAYNRISEATNLKS